MRCSYLYALELGIVCRLCCVQQILLFVFAIEFLFDLSEYLYNPSLRCVDTVCVVYTIVWEKLVVGNIHEKEIRSKKFLS